MKLGIFKYGDERGIKANKISKQDNRIKKVNGFDSRITIKPNQTEFTLNVEIFTCVDQDCSVILQSASGEVTWNGGMTWNFADEGDARAETLQNSSRNLIKDGEPLRKKIGKEVLSNEL